MNIRMDEEIFAKNSKGKIYHEVLMLKKCLQNKPEVKNMNFNC